MNQESKNVELSESESTNEQTEGRRDFIKKFGKYGVATPVAITTLMAAGPKTAAASGFCSFCGNRDSNPVEEFIELVDKNILP